MKRILLALFALLSCMLSHAQQISWIWAKRAGGNSDQQAKALAADVLDNTYITGFISGNSNDFDNVLLNSTGGHDIIIAKYDPSGNVMWVKKAGSGAHDEGLDITVDAAGNIFVCGYFESTCTFYGLTNVTLTSTGGRDAFVAKFDAMGNVLWANKAGSTGDDEARSICTDGISLFVTGYFRSTATFGTATLSSSGGKDVFISSYNALTGTVNWALKGGSTNDDTGEAIAVDGNYIYATGTYRNNISFNTLGTLTNSGNDDAFIVKYDIWGNGLWKTRLSGSDVEIGKSIAVSSPYVYAGGYYRSTATFYNPSAATISITAAAAYDGFTAQLDAATGNALWAVTAGGNNDDEVHAIAAVSSGDIISTGYFEGTLPAATGNLTSVDDDVFVIRYDQQGNIVWAKNGGGSNSDRGLGITCSATDNIYVSGYSKSSDATFGNTTFASVGNQDILLAKIGCISSGGTAAASSNGACAGTPVTLTLNNYNGNIQWQSSAPNANSWSNITGAIFPSLTITPNSSTDYRAMVSQAACGTSASNIVPVTVNPAAQLMINSSALSICAGDSTSINVSGASSYTWQPPAGLSATTGSSVNASPQSSTTYIITAIDSNGCSSAAQASVQVNARPIITVTPSSITICSGMQAPLSASGALAYTWSPASSLNSSTGPAVIASPGATTIYTVTGTALNGCTAAAACTVNVDPGIFANTISGDQVLCSGAQPAPITGSIPSGGNGIYAYLWEESYDNILWLPALGLNTLIDYLPPVLSDTMYYRRMVTSGGCAGVSSSSSNTSSMRVQPSITNNNISGAQVLCSGGSPAMLSGSQASGGDGTYSYLWMESIDGNSWQPAQGTNSTPDYYPPALSDTMHYMRTTESGSCTGNFRSSSNTERIDVQQDITGNIISSSQVICEGDAAAIIVGASPYGGDGTYSYLWLESTDGLSWQPASVTNNQPDLSPGMTSNDIWYRRTINSGTCADTSQPVSINVSSRPAAMITGADTICEGDNISLSVALTGSSPWTIDYTDGNTTWTINNIGASSYSWNMSPSATSVYTLLSVSDNTGCTGNTSGNASAAVNATPAANAGSDIEICGTEASLSASSSQGSASWTSAAGIQFSDANDPSTSITLPGYGTYTCEWIVTNGTCSAQDEVMITAYEPVQPVSAGPDQQIYFGEAAQLSASAPNAGTGTWTVLAGSCSLSDAGSPNTSVTGLQSGETALVWTVSNGACGSSSDTVILRVNELFIPSGFSPNDDNRNDVFLIKGLEGASNTSLVVFNRWGSEVFRAEPYRNDWRGRNMSGEALAEDTYFYILSIDNRKETGYIVIKRK